MEDTRNPGAPAPETGADVPVPGWCRGDAVACFLLPMAFALLVSLKINPDLFRGGLINPDSAMRLVRLREILAAHAPLHSVLRDGSGDGTVLHWSHLLDSLLLLLGAPIAAFAGWDTGITGAAMIAGPLSLGLLGLACGWAILPLRPAPPWFGSLAMVLSVPILSYGYAGVVHHHVLLVVCATMTAGWALRCLSGRNAGSAGLSLGVWAGAGLWLSPETVPFTLMAFGLVWVVWLQRPRDLAVVAALTTSGAGLFGVTTLAWLVDPPLAGYGAIEPDRISVMYVWLGAGAAVCAAWAWVFARPLAAAPAWLARVAVLGGAAVLAVGWLTAFPHVLRGTQGLMTAEQARAFFTGIEEMAPVAGVAEGLEYLGGGVAGLLFLVIVLWRRPSLPLAYAVACAVVLVALAAMHVRFAAYPAALGAALLPVMLGRVAETLRSAPHQRRAFARTSLMAGVLLIPKLGQAVAPAQAGPTEPGQATSCQLEQAATLLAPYADAVVLAPINDGPELLRRTAVRTVGTLYHRNVEGFMRLRSAWLSAEEASRPALDAARVDLILVCPGKAASAGAPVDPTLLGRLEAGQPPAWLTLIGGASDGLGYQLYRYDR